MIGKVFERLTVIQLLGSVKGGRLWLCQCSCGNTTKSKTVDLNRRHIRSCGCLHAEMISALGKKRRQLWADGVKLFRSKLDKSAGPGGCWKWTGCTTGQGYGTINIEGRSIKTHRLAWMIAHGRDIPAGMLICHHCDNPPCCNPDHLFLGTVADNNRDKMIKGRHRTRKKKG